MHALGRLLDPELVERIAHMAMGARRVVVGTTAGQHRTPLRGASVEFRQHRSYAPGDEPRRIDWRVLARTDRTYVREYDEETNLRATFLLDASGSMAYGRPDAKFDYARRLTAALAYLALSAGEAVGLTVAARTAPSPLAASSAGEQLAHVIDVLEPLAPAGAAGLDLALPALAGRLGRRSLVVVVSDFLLPVARLQRGLAGLVHGRHEAVLVRVLHPDEIEFPFDAWTQFVGYEGEPVRRADAGRLRKTYLENFRRHEREFRTACDAAGCDMLTLRTDRPLIDGVTTVVTRRGGGACS